MRVAIESAAPPLWWCAACQINCLNVPHSLVSLFVFFSMPILKILSKAYISPLLFPPQEGRAFRKYLPKVVTLGTLFALFAPLCFCKSPS